MAPRAAARLEQLGFRDVAHYAGGKSDWMSAGLPIEGENDHRPNAGTVARRDVPVCGVDDRLAGVDRRMGVAVVVDRDRIVVGMLREDELTADPRSRVEDVMVSGPSTFRPYVPIDEMARYMSEHDLASSPITTSDGRLVGCLFRDDAVRAARG